MKKQVLLLASLLWVGSAVHGAGSESGAAVDVKGAFDRLRSLAGEWEAKTDTGTVRATYEVIAGGSALVERTTMANMPVMETIYHPDGGRLLLTTPNIISYRALAGILQGYHPGFFPAYIRPDASGNADARHNREYAPMEVQFLLRDAGFELESLTTGPFLGEPKPEFGWVKHLLERYQLFTTLRGDDIYALGRKSGPVKDRYPAWLYSGGE